MTPSDLAHRIVDQLRSMHHDCEHESCPLGGLWAEDVQEILDLAADDNDKDKAS